MNPSSWVDAGGEGLQVVWEDDERVLCRGWRGGAGGDRNAVLAVLPAAEHPTPGSLNRLTHEYELKDDLDAAWAVRPLELVREHGRTMLVLEDPGGEPLDGLLGPPMEVRRFLRLGVALSAALGRLHERGLIHKDIKPANVLVNRATGQVWLTGFGIASRLPRERQPPEPPEAIAGTLAYMAPEQTGRMNRSIDSRSDLYSLGVTLYQMVSGILPFSASDPMEWIHCHIARPPVPPGERLKDVPAPVFAIILKLLAKTAEDRYQTAAGVEADLRKCLTELESLGHIGAFTLGAHDTSDRLLMPEKLYGRDRERQALLDAFDQVVATGTRILVLVSGYSGIGKSSVVNELDKAVVQPRGIFLSGKFDQHKRDIPYATIAQAFQTLTRQVLSKSDAEVDRWREAIRAAVSPNGQLIVNLIPELEFVIGKQPPIPELPPTEAQGRFHMVFRSFLGVVARKEHPLALFLDDLQWLDAATLRLLGDLARHPDVSHLLLIGAFRDNEVGPAHPLVQTLDAVRESGAIVRDIVLTPLSLDDVTEFVADTLHCTKATAAPLARLLHEKTLGNPFFAIQFLTALREEHLLAFDAREEVWTWDLDRIHARGFTDNVVDLMVGKLKRLPAATQEALKQLACLGNRADIATLSIVDGKPADQVHQDLWDAILLGFVVRLEGSFKFVHDRVQEAAYSLIPAGLRAEAHLRIGRALLARMAHGEIADRTFDVVNQLNSGISLVTDWNEKQQIAELNLRAARRAKASTAYSSACAYLSAATTLLGPQGWESRHDLAFDVWLERAECEFLGGRFDAAERLIQELLRRGASRIEKAAAYRIKIDLHVVKSENARAIDSALECLRLFGIDMPAHPTSEQVHAEYEAVWRSLGGRPIGSLIDLPLMSDPEMQAAMRVLSVLFAPAIFTDLNLTFLHLCKMLNLSLRSGSTDAAAVGYVWFGILLGPLFHRYEEGYHFGKLACDLVEKHGFAASRAKTYFAMEIAVLWTQPIATALRYLESAFRAGIETGDLTIACYSRNHKVTDLLLQGDPLDEVWRETERGLDFVRKARFRDVADIIVSQQRFILDMQGKTSAFSTFSGEGFDESAFEAQLNDDRMSTMVCWYWILKLQARFISGDHDAAIAASRKAKRLLWSSVGHIQLLDYHYYAALAVAALYRGAASAGEQRDVLTAHLEQLREWSQNGSATFRDRFELVAAEIARIEGRDLVAMQLYEQATRSARENGFVQSEGIANELAGRFYLERGLETNGNAHLRNARACFAQWGADGKVRQLDSRYPRLAAPGGRGPGETMGSVQQLDVTAVVKASQAVSGEIVLPSLIERLMTIALQNAGADRGLLILPQKDRYRIEAEAWASGDKVVLRQGSIAGPTAPEALIRYVIRTQKSVIIDDASRPNLFSEDAYFSSRQPRSVFCLPLLRQGTWGGLLYLENTLTSHVFTPDRTALLELLASQAAISLENTRLYGDLQEREAKVRRLVDSNIIGIFLWDLAGGIIEANEAFLHMVQHGRDDLVSGRVRWTDLTPAEWRDRDQRAVAELAATGTIQPYEKEYLRKDGSRVPVLIGAAAFGEGRDQGVAFVVDLTERKRAEGEVRESERRYREVQMQLAHANRVATTGQLSASIAHEVNQPLAAVVTNAGASLRWLDYDPPDVAEARAGLERILKAGTRAGDIIGRLRRLVRKAPLQKEPLDLDETILEVVALTRGEVVKNDVLVQTQLAEGLPPIHGDRVQLQQVILNLIVNAVDAMTGVGKGSRELLISTGRAEPDGVLVAVRDSGLGLSPESLERLFETFYTTKPGGMGVGLSICRSIIEAHGGRLWATANVPRGAIFQFTLPAGPNRAS
jgi:PAS domain S-box-containing protein